MNVPKSSKKTPLSSKITPRTPLVVLVGPTAVGKSDVAQILAKELAGAVVSVDAFQIYRGMDIGTAKLPPEKRLVPHYLLDIAPIDEDYSVARFQQEGRSVVDKLLAAGTMPVLAGGSGLYLDALIDEMSFPYGKIESVLRQEFEAIAREEGSEALYKLLQERDPEAAALIENNNVRRIIRALEMQSQGISYAAQHKDLKKHKVHYPAALYVLTLRREVLYERIDARVDEMFEQGFLDEVKRLKQEGLEKTHTAKQAIGYKEVLGALAGEISLDEAKAEMKKRSRHYAKRQLSWVKRDGRSKEIAMDSTTPEEAAERILDVHFHHE